MDTSHIFASWSCRATWKPTPLLAPVTTWKSPGILTGTGFWGCCIFGQTQTEQIKAPTEDVLWVSRSQWASYCRCKGQGHQEAAQPRAHARQPRLVSSLLVTWIFLSRGTWATHVFQCPNILSTCFYLPGLVKREIDIDWPVLKGRRYTLHDIETE
jgi:hypothetical protein